MISGLEFSKLCKWSVCPRYPIIFDLNKIMDNDFIFINLDSIYQFIDYLNFNNFNKKINIITHNSDLSFNKDMLDKIRKFTQHIYCINSIVSDNLITKIPLGFSDKLEKIITKVNKEDINKTDLIYLNFEIRNDAERIDCFNIFKDKEWIKIGQYLGHNDENKQMFFWNELKNSKYSLCPVGIGLDTHRFWESLYFGTIPIIKRNELVDLYENLPCKIINNWSEITEEDLVKKYDYYLTKYKNWINENENWINSDFWIKKNIKL